MVLGKFIKILVVIFLLYVKNAQSNNLALPCYGCHGAKESTIPSINGLTEEYFISSFNEYKNNKREHYIMRIIAKGYSEKEIKMLAKYFEKINEN